MPLAVASSLPKRPCASPGCPELTDTGRLCSRCSGRKDEVRGSSTSRGYGRMHAILRVRCFVRDEWKCQKCGWEPDIVRLSRLAGLDVPPTERVLEELRHRFHQHERHLHADHTIPIKRAPELAQDIDNMQSLCDVCHSAKSLLEGE